MVRELSVLRVAAGSGYQHLEFREDDVSSFEEGTVGL
jgi:hypothetical protein